MGRAGAKGPLSPGLLHNGKLNPIARGAEKKVIPQTKKKKVPGLSKNHLETSDKNIDDLVQVYQVCHETSKFHLFKNAFMLGSSPPSLIPSTHIWKGLQCC